MVFQLNCIEKDGDFKLDGVFLIVFWLLVCPVNTAIAQKPYLTGLIPPVPGKESQYPKVEEQLRNNRTLPVSVVNIKYLPVVRQQKLDNCGAFAATYYYKTWQEAKEHDWLRPDPAVDPEHIMSPGFTYPLTNASRNAGANTGAVMEIISRYGCATWKTMPENPVDWVSYPQEGAWREAMNFRGKSVVRFPTQTDSDLTLLKVHLAGGDLAVIGVEIYSDTFYDYPDSSCVGVDNDVVYNHGSQRTADHAFTLIGYDDHKTYSENGVQRQGAFLAVNSWGTDWGVTVSGAGSGGFVWLSYDYVKSRRGYLYTNEGALTMVDRIAYQPHDIAVLRIYHPRRDELRIGIVGGARPNTEDDWLPAFPTGGSLMPFDGTIWVDVTDFYTNLPLAYWLRVEDLAVTGWSETTGQVKAFSIERDGKVILHCDNLPQDTVDEQIDFIYAGLMVDSGRPLTPLADGCYRLAIGDSIGNDQPDLAAVSGGNVFGYNTGGNIFWKNAIGNFVSLDADMSDLFVANLAWADFDRDGFQDIIVGGYTSTDSITRLLHNNGFGSFSMIPSIVPGFGNPHYAWGDYDNDGDLDLAVQGKLSSGTQVTRLYRNDAGSLVDTNVALPAVFNMPVSWADIDNDGWLDLAVGSMLYKNMGDATFSLQADPVGIGSSGMISWFDYDRDGRVDFVFSQMQADTGTPETLICRNQGNFNFTVSSTIIGLYNGDLSWGDMDGDGICDLAVCGYPTMISTEGMITRIYRQLPDGRFVDTGMDLTGVGDGGLRWLDIDADGDPDLIASGLSPRVVEPDAPYFNKTTTIYENRAAWEPARFQPPPSPIGLSAGNGGVNFVLLNWTMPEGNSSAYRFDIRVGTRPGASDVISAADSVLSGIRRGRIDYADGRVGLLLRYPSSSQYFFWSVRAVDAAGNVSAWSPDSGFIVDNGVKIVGDINGDGVIDVADVVCSEKLLQSGESLPICADINLDGRVNEYDTLALAHKLIGKTTAGFSSIVSQTVGSDGGIVNAGEISIEIPPGALDSTYNLTVSSSTSDPGYGSQGERIVYQITGFPEYHNQPITLRLPDHRTDFNSTPWVALGRESATIGVSSSRFAYRCCEATPVAGGRTVVQIPANPYPENIEGDNLRAQRSKSNHDFILKINLLTDSQWRYNGNPRFTILAPLDLKSKLPSVADALQAAWDDIRINLGINPQPYRDWVNHPLEVFIEDVGVDKNGVPYAGLTQGGNNEKCYIILSYRALKKGDPKFLKVTAAHEFLHIIQNFFDSRWDIARWSSDPNLWLNEAEATWYEYRIAALNGDTKFTENNFTGYRPMMFAGGAGIVEDAAHFGYGNATVVQHVVEQLGLPGIKSLMEQAHDGHYGFEAIDQVLKEPDNAWLDKMLFAMLKKPYFDWDTSIIRSVISSAHKISIKAKDDLNHRFKCNFLAGFAVDCYQLAFSPKVQLLTSDDKLAFKLVGDNHKRMQVLLKGYGDEIASLGNAVFNPSENASRITIPDIKTLVESPKTTIVMPVVTNTENVPPYINETSACLYYGCVRDYQNEPLPQWTVTNSCYQSVIFPSFICTGSFTSTDTGNLIIKDSLNSDGSLIKTVKMDLWGSTPVVEIEFVVTPEKTELDVGIDHYQMVGPISFKVTQYKMGKPYTPWDVINSWETTDDHFSLSANSDSEPAYYVISAIFNIRHTTTNGVIDNTSQFGHSVASFWLNHM